MTREEALQFKERWSLVDEVMLAELLQAPLELKVRQLAAMFVGGERSEAESAEIEKVRNRWAKLKAAYHA